IRHPGARHHVFHRGPDPTPGDANVLLFLLAVDLAVRVHVPVSRHAPLGASTRGSVTAYPFPADRPRHPAQGQRPRRHRPAALANRAVCRHCTDDRREAVPADAGLEKKEKHNGTFHERGYTPSSHRKAPGVEYEVGVLFYTPAIWQSDYAAKSTFRAIAASVRSVLFENPKS